MCARGSGSFAMSILFQRPCAGTQRSGNVLAVTWPDAERVPGFELAGERFGGRPRIVSVASMPIAAGSRPAARAYPRMVSIARRPKSSGSKFGIQPSPSRATRRIAASEMPPIQTGIGRWTGNGLTPPSTIR